MKLIITLLIFLITANTFAQELRIGRLDKKSVLTNRKQALLKILVYTKDAVFRGTGFFISKKGHFLTNLHVLEQILDPNNQAQVEFLTPNGDRLENINIIKCGDQRRADICYLKANNYRPKAWFPVEQKNIIQTKVTFFAFGNSQEDFGAKSGKFVKHWQDVGGFFGFGRRRWNKSVKTFETTILLERGDSGGPLFDHLGRVIGMTCSYYQTGRSRKRHNIAISITELFSFIKNSNKKNSRKIDPKRYKKQKLEDLYGEI